MWSKYLKYFLNPNFLLLYCLEITRCGAYRPVTFQVILDSFSLKGLKSKLSRMEALAGDKLL